MGVRLGYFIRPCGYSTLFDSIEEDNTSTERGMPTQNEWVRIGDGFRFPRLIPILISYVSTHNLNLLSNLIMSTMTLKINLEVNMLHASFVNLTITCIFSRYGPLFWVHVGKFLFLPSSSM